MKGLRNGFAGDLGRHRAGKGSGPSITLSDEEKAIESYQIAKHIFFTPKH